MIKRILCVLALSFTFQVNAAATDEELCAHYLGDLTKQMSDAHAETVKETMTSLLVDAYRRFGAPIKEDQILFSSPAQTFNEPDLMTVVTAKVDAGPDAILAQGISSLEYRSSFARVNEVDDLGRIKGTKLVCSMTTTAFPVQLINVTSKQVIDFYDDLDPIEITIELP